ncbi:SMUG2 DNA glycosylase family protein [Pseudoflavitalea sp. G-6-1-2]|uniref:uracil-DNA glycosylase family protein n=1 Tax=Pseudoflavitalea sp. G-6-1-2 TaxID=2728841 RepID=UPI00146F79C4|nr:uracil-DNA glycosylase family protein [Pseudoflavitalea sp. G-6-1-2]NML23770.1 SMUG2 DNA glycosylase family protein [Pseudoflavitalea sp. G-6-1-2]
MTTKLTQSYAILNFYKNLQPNFAMPEGVEIMNPFADEASSELATRFYNKFYNDTHPRKFIFGINPGRFGGGVTGVPFTDPIRLEIDCAIPNDMPKKAELSSIFIYEVIKLYGGATAFYNNFFITALSPLGFTKNGLNLNYYDDKELLKASEPFIIDTIRTQQRNIRSDSDTCFCLGEGTNFKIFQKLNKQHGFFKEIIPLPHPRWVMQYRRKQIPHFAEVYVEKLRG